MTASKTNTFITHALQVQIFTTLAFALNEKIRKELFIVGLTNAKTKRQLMQYFDSIKPSCIIGKEGNILLFNTGFE